jgi:hypothetical protein
MKGGPFCTVTFKNCVQKGGNMRPFLLAIVSQDINWSESHASL